MFKQTFDSANLYCTTIYSDKQQVYQCLNDFTKGAMYMHYLHEN